MKNLFLTLIAVVGLAMFSTSAYADRDHGGYGDHGDRGGYGDHRDHGDRGWYGGGHERDHGYFNGGDRDHHYYHGWVWGFAPPAWFLPGITVCREYSVQRQIGYDAYGRPVFVLDQHVDCQDQFGVWIIIR